MKNLRNQKVYKSIVIGQCGIGIRTGKLMNETNQKTHLHVEEKVKFCAIEKGQSDRYPHRKKLDPSPHKKHEYHLQKNFLNVKGKTTNLLEFNIEKLLQDLEIGKNISNMIQKSNS